MTITIRYRAVLGLLLLGILLGGLVGIGGAASADANGPTGDGAELDAAAELLAWPGEDRAALDLPDAWWEAVAAEMEWPAGTPIGYGPQWMENVPQHPYLLRQVKTLFQDVRGLPRWTGSLTDGLLENADDPSQVIRTAFALMDARASRGYVAPGPDSWGLPDLDEAAINEDGSLDADAAIGLLAVDGGLEEAHWQLLSPARKRFVVRAIIAHHVAQPWVVAAYDVPWFEQQIARINPDDPQRALYELATAPWTESAAEPIPASYEAMNRIDMSYLAVGSVIHSRHMIAAINEYEAALEASELERDWRIEHEGRDPLYTIITTEHGDVLLALAPFNPPGGFSPALGTGYNPLRDGDHPTYLGISVARGTYLPRSLFVPHSFDCPIAAIVDLGGGSNQYVYESDRESREPIPGTGPGSGIFGLSSVYDIRGNDLYLGGQSSVGNAWYGCGLIYDTDGDDRYILNDSWGIGAAHFGVGVVIDTAGDDRYECGHEAQGFGSTMGVGLLIDTAGTDSYLARPDANPSEPFNNLSVSFAQGAAFGRRADFDDGHSLAGGIGVLVDGGDGDDRYSGNVYCQGTGYWWGLGICEDRGGDDTYRSQWYANGSAPHFAIGVQVDLSGDDDYNVGPLDAPFSVDDLNRDAQGLYGEARDGSIGVFYDGDGNDRYRLSDRSGGDGNLNSIGLFWDRRGNDTYIPLFHRRAGNPLSIHGSATALPNNEMRNYRDRMPTIGLFLDTGGDDDYRNPIWAGRWEQPEQEPPTTPNPAANNTRWRYPGDLPAFGLGEDANRYPARSVDEAPADEAEPE